VHIYPSIDILRSHVEGLVSVSLFSSVCVRAYILRLHVAHTGTSALPPRGFAHLMGSDGARRFSILRVSDVHRLPQAHTCFNELGA
jgi:hypothetical protein